MREPLVLDTHAWVRYLASPEVLPKGLVRTPDEARRREARYISAITPWEVRSSPAKDASPFPWNPGAGW